MLQLQELKYIRSRSVMVDGHGKEYNVIKQPNKNRYYIQHAHGQLTVTTAITQEVDYVLEYFSNCQTYPCPAMDYWIIRHRMKQKITTKQFKVKYPHTFKIYKAL